MQLEQLYFYYKQDEKRTNNNDWVIISETIN